MRLLPISCALALAFPSCGPSSDAAGKPGTVLITGSNRGIGLEFARQYAAAGWKVIATARKPESANDLQTLAKDNPKVTVERLDVTDHAGIDGLAAKYEGTPIDVVINNAGIQGNHEKQLLGSFDYPTFELVNSVNVYGPLRIAQAFVENVAASTHKKIVTITSSSGSLTLAAGKGSGLYYYRISKAAVNMAMITLAADVKKRGIAVGIFSPGAAVNTRMLRQTYKGPAMEPPEAVGKLIASINALNTENSGQFLQEGATVPW